MLIKELTQKWEAGQSTETLINFKLETKNKGIWLISPDGEDGDIRILRSNGGNSFEAKPNWLDTWCYTNETTTVELPQEIAEKIKKLMRKQVGGQGKYQCNQCFKMYNNATLCECGLPNKSPQIIGDDDDIICLKVVVKQDKDKWETPWELEREIMGIKYPQNGEILKMWIRIVDLKKAYREEIKGTPYIIWKQYHDKWGSKDIIYIYKTKHEKPPTQQEKGEVVFKFKYKESFGEVNQKIGFTKKRIDSFSRRD